MLLVFCICDTAACRASAYFVREQSATAMANAFAGTTAGADDLTYMFFNGAALSRQKGSAVAVVSSVILSSAKFGHGEASTLTGAPLTGGNGGSNAGGTWLVPALYGVWDLAESFDWRQPVRLGLAINAPFGFETEYQDGWIGRYYALHSRLQVTQRQPGNCLDTDRRGLVGGRFADAAHRCQADQRHRFRQPRCGREASPAPFPVARTASASLSAMTGDSAGPWVCWLNRSPAPASVSAGALRCITKSRAMLGCGWIPPALVRPSASPTGPPRQRRR